jgi:hypothetical protein
MPTKRSRKTSKRTVIQPRRGERESIEQAHVLELNRLSVMKYANPRRNLILWATKKNARKNAREPVPDRVNASLTRWNLIN